MKNKATPTLHDNDQPNAALAGGNSGARQIFKLGLDVDLNNAVTAIQCGAGDIKRGQSFSRARLLGWVRTQVNAGTRSIPFMRRAVLATRCIMNWWGPGHIRLSPLRCVIRRSAGARTIGWMRASCVCD